MKGRSMSLFHCLDCNMDTYDVGEYYMVKDLVWSAANPTQKGMLCIGCLEKRLDRTLTHADFLDCSLNTECGSKSDRLKDRLQGFGRRKNND